MFTTKIQSETKIEQRSDTMEETYILPPSGSLTAPSRTAMPESAYSNLDILKSPVLVDSAPWVATAASGTVLMTLSIPALFADLPNYHRAMLQVYTYMRMNMQIEFQVNSTKFHLGKLIIFWDPFEQISPVPDLPFQKPLNIYTASAQPHVQIDASYSNSAILHIPFEHILSYLTTNSKERSPQMGIVRVMILNPLQVATGVTSTLTVNALLSCSDVKLHVPIIPHEVQFGDIPPGLEQQGLGEGIKNFWNKGGKAISAAKDTAVNFSTGNFSGAAASGGQSLSSALEMFGLDKPSEPNIKTGNCLATVAPFAHMKGVDTSVRLGAEPTGGYLQDDFSAAPIEETKISNIIQTPVLYDQITWTPDDAVGLALFRIPVYPGISKFEPPNFFPMAGTNCYAPTFLSFMSQFFTFWHGGITFRYDFAATQFHTGRLLFVFEPNTETITLDSESMASLTSNPHLIFDLHEQKTVEMTIPYVSSTPRKIMPNRPFLDSDAIIDDAYIIGYLSCFVYTKLSTVTDVSSNVLFNCYIKGAPDFVFESPMLNLYTTEGPLAGLEQQGLSDPLEARTVNPIVSNVLLKGSGQVAIEPHFGETIDNVLELCKRFYLLETDKIPLATIPTVIISSGYVDLRVGFDNNVPADPKQTDAFRRISTMFTFWSGSLRYKFVPYVPRTATAMSRATYMFGRLTVTSAEILPTEPFSYPTLQNFVGQDNSAEVECPFFSIYNQCLVNIPTTTDTGSFVDDYIVNTGILRYTLLTDRVNEFPVDSGGVHYTMVETWRSAGDDFRFRLLVCPQPMYFQSSATP